MSAVAGMRAAGTDAGTAGAALCRLCGTALRRSFADLGMSPMANSYIRPERAAAMEPFYPLHAYTCENCRLVQLAQFETPQRIFGDYLYFSSYSESWLRHAETYAARMVERFRLDKDSLAVEVASNDGYLLQFLQSAGLSVLGIDPAANVAQVAIGRGIPTEISFFGAATAHRLRRSGCVPDLMTANNVLAHVPDLHDFVEGFRILLAADGVVTFEFPHLLRLMQENQFDTIYHEHFSYLSLLVVQKLLDGHGLAVFDVEQLPTHGGSLRVYACHAASARAVPLPTVGAVLSAEIAAGLDGMEAYDHFAERTVAVKCALLDFLVRAKRERKVVAAYGAPAKGNTLLNYCGVGPELIGFTVDSSPHKQGLLLPGTRIPIRHPDALIEARPDYLLILPWNLRHEIATQVAAMPGWRGRFVVPIPELQEYRATTEQPSCGC